MAEKHEFPDEEYQFSEIEGEDVFTSLSREEPKPKGGQGRKRALFAIIIIVVLLALYKLLGLFFASKEKVVEKPVVPPSVKVAPAPPPPQPTPTKVERAPQTVEIPKEFANNLERTTQQTIDNTSNINNLQSRLADIESNMGNVNQKVSEVNDRLQAIQQQLAELKKPEIPIAKIVQEPKKIRRKIHHHPAPVYHLKAMLPGRAWLKANNGDTMTVTVGKLLNGYGKITHIDIEGGRVLTSSGRVITYSADDR